METNRTEATAKLISEGWVQKGITFTKDGRSGVLAFFPSGRVELHEQGRPMTTEDFFNRTPTVGKATVVIDA